MGALDGMDLDGVQPRTREALTAISDALDAVDPDDGGDITFTPAGSIAATTVQDAIVELDGSLTDHIGDTADAHDASAISVADAGNVFTGTTVEAVLAELEARVAALE